MNVLLISNSYGVDATRYLQKIARADGVEINTVCLYIGGCSLDHHFRNMHSEKPVYELHINGEKSGFFVSLKNALLNREWDVITFQQASGKSFDFNNYKPYLAELSSYVKKLCPKAKQYIHQTWCDAPESLRLSEFGFSSNKEMIEKAKEAYNEAALSINADGILKSGELVYSLFEKGLSPVWRDHGHISLGLGRFAAGLLWYQTLTGNDVFKNTFCDLDEKVTEEEIKIIKECVANLK